MKANKLKIVYLLTGLRLGGAETQVLLLAKSMIEEGAEVRVIAMESGGAMVDQFKKKNIPVTELGIKGGSDLWQGYKNLKSLIKEINPNVIHSHMIHANLLARIFKLFNPKYKVVCTAHNISEGSKTLMAGYRLTRSVADWSTNVSFEAYEHYVNKGYFLKRKSSYVPNAIDTSYFDSNVSNRAALLAEFKISNESFIFFSAGRLHAQKNHKMLIQAFNQLKDQVPHVKLLIAGEGDLKAELEELIADLGIEDRVKLLGRRSDMLHLLNLCNCFVLSSDYEGFGLVVGEAMACLKPVIATDCGGVKEVMDNFYTLTEKGNQAAMANAMLQACKTEYPVTYLEDARQHIVKTYAVDKIIDTWLSIYN